MEKVFVAAIGIWASAVPKLSSIAATQPCLQELLILLGFSFIQEHYFPGSAVYHSLQRQDREFVTSNFASGRSFARFNNLALLLAINWLLTAAFPAVLAVHSHGVDSFAMGTECNEWILLTTLTGTCTLFIAWVLQLQSLGILTSLTA